MFHFVLCVLAILLPQEPPKEDREKVLDDLEARFKRQGILRVDLEYQTTEKGEKPVKKGEATFWFSRTARRLTVTMHNLATGEKTWGELSGDVSYYWNDKGEAKRVDMTGVMDSFFTDKYEADTQVDRLVDEASTYASREAYFKSLQPVVNFGMDPPKTPDEKASWRFALGRSTSGRIAHISEVRSWKEGAFEKLPDAWRFTSRDGKKSVLLDSETGMVREIVAEGVGIEARGRSTIKTVDAFPALKRPERFDEDAFTPSHAESFRHGLMLGSIAGCLSRILKNWDKAGSPEKAPQLKAFLRDIAASRIRFVRAVAAGSAAEEFVRDQVAAGRTLEDLEKDLESLLGQLRPNLEKKRAEVDKDSRGFVDAALSLVLKEAAKKQYPSEASQEFQSVAKSALNDADILKTLEGDPPPDLKEILRQAIQSARKKE